MPASSSISACLTRSLLRLSQRSFSLTVRVKFECTLKRVKSRNQEEPSRSPSEGTTSWLENTTSCTESGSAAKTAGALRCALAHGLYHSSSMSTCISQSKPSAAAISVACRTRTGSNP